MVASKSKSRYPPGTFKFQVQHFLRRGDSCMMGDTYSHLSIHERARIEMYLVLGTRSSQIAEYLERSPSTISREIHRNGWRRPTILPRPGKKLVAGGYNCERADHRARRQSTIPRVARKLVPGTALWALMSSIFTAA